jgi:uncharacterized membrane protein
MIKQLTKLIFLVSFAIILVGWLAPASLANDEQAISSTAGSRFFKAEVSAVLQEQTTKLIDGTETRQQNVKIVGREGEYKDQSYIFQGIDEYDAISKNLYSKGDRVIAVETIDAEGNKYYYITDYDRSRILFWLFVSFVAVLFAVGGVKGLKSVLSLFLTFLVVIKLIIPAIIAGYNPVVISGFGGLLILVLVVYLTEGFKRKSHLAMAGMVISLFLTIFISWLFVNLANLSGLSSEEASSVMILGKQAINFKGLLLAAIIIGALGVLDDVVVSQVSAVEQLRAASPYQTRKELFQRAFKIGVSHISSMTNTLFLAYAGVSMPLLILFISGNSAFTSWGQVINNENIAEEIVRTIAGSIGLILSVPLSTAIAVWFGGQSKSLTGESSKDII